MESFQQQFERRLSAEVLLMFQKSGPVWNGDLTYKKLFEFWRDINPINNTHSQQHFDTNLELGDTTLVNIIGEEATLTYEVSASEVLFQTTIKEIWILSQFLTMFYCFPWTNCYLHLSLKNQIRYLYWALRQNRISWNILRRYHQKRLLLLLIASESNSEDDNTRTSTHKQFNKNFSDEHLPSVSGINQLT